MKLEAAIKSTKPLPPHQRSYINILFTASWLDCQFSRVLRPYGITGPQYNILRILNGSAPAGLSVLEIKNRMIDRSSNVSRLVEKLKQSGLAERVASSVDRRMVEVTISEKGKETLQEINLFFKDGKQFSGNNLSEAEATTLADLLDKFREG